ncbi:hypothetical protein LINPERPRIM_LOCUS37375, partial [Linum perenne]
KEGERKQKFPAKKLLSLEQKVVLISEIYLLGISAVLLDTFRIFWQLQDQSGWSG